MGHRRLSIIDLAPTGSQPMSYRGYLWVTYNGELYNYIELKRELSARGHTFRSSSDTEVLLAAFDEWGPECFERFRGMWGLVLFDARHGHLYLSRDRLGIKPLYLLQLPGLLAIASEVKQFRSVPGFTPRIDPAVAAEFLATGYEDPDRSFYKSVRPWPAGTWGRISTDSLEISEPHTYWKPELIEASIDNQGEAGRLFAHKLEESVSIHLRSDVPVGCALSGGLDSSAIAALAAKLRDGGAPLQAFSSVFPGDPVDEGTHVKAVVDHISAEAHRCQPEPLCFLDELDDFLWTHHEPVGGASVYAAYCVARLTHQAGIKVTLNGQGGDEILSGYWQSYFLHLSELTRRLRPRSLMEHVVGAALPGGNRTMLTQVPVMLSRYRARRGGRSILAGRPLSEEKGRALLTEALELDGVGRRVLEIRTLFLPRLLKWEDRNSMAFSVEGRYPFLDHELIELCLRFTPRALYSRGWTKVPLRRGLVGLLPEAILTRRDKIGFEVPQEKWLAGPLRPALKQWLSEDRPLWGYLDRSRVRQLAEETWNAARVHKEQGQALFRAFTFDRWLDRCGVEA